ncbi:MAG: hypothetical protein KDD69_10070 [Bdellovibrionales bacterium]|nr:hypothetical protein [Bdellovibrionales bacterium]
MNIKPTASNSKRIILLLTALVVLISLKLCHTALTHAQWREFWVTELHLVVSAIALVFLLRD